MPPLLTQKKIAAILSAYDNLIENNNQRIKILEEMAQSIYREWFVNFRFPGHEDIRMVESELGPIPEGWVATTLGEAAAVTMGQSPKSEFYNEEGEGLPFHQGVTNFGHRYPEDRVFCTAGTRFADEGDILMSVRAPVGRLNISNQRMVLGRGLCGVKGGPGHHWYLFHHLSKVFEVEDVMGSGTIFQSVTKQDVLGIPLPEPKPHILRSFNDLVEPTEQEVQVLTKKNDILRQTRDLLLPKLISGDLDVEDLDIAVA